VISGDGCLMEGISHEAGSLAGHLGLNKLILFYDCNRITIEGSTDLAYSDDVRRRFQGYHWNVLEIDAHDYDQIDRAIARARREKTRPTIVICHSHIAQGAPTKHDTAAAHGEPLGDDEIRAAKRGLGLPEDARFYVSDRVRELFAARAGVMKTAHARWVRQFKKYTTAHPDRGADWVKFYANEIPADLETFLPAFPLDKDVATRVSGGQVLQAMAKAIPQLVGGAADLAPSTKTLINGGGSVGPKSFGGRNLHFGIREHGMCAMLNGMALHGGWRVFGATFFVFADYCRPSLRLAALMKLPVIYVFTHDSFYVGEDGPTHEPVEHLASLRAMPNMTVIRPADATESGAAWVAALKNTTGPTVLALTRHNLPVIDRQQFPPASQLDRGAYTLWQSGTGLPDLLLIASGSEVTLALKAARELAVSRNVRVVSMPSMELFDRQDAAYRHSVLPPACVKRLAIEAGVAFGWDKYIGPQGRMLSMNRFGASGPYKDLARHFGFTVENVVALARDL